VSVARAGSTQNLTCERAAPARRSARGSANAPREEGLRAVALVDKKEGAAVGVAREADGALRECKRRSGAA
jgi:hypothetical protein